MKKAITFAHLIILISINQLKIEFLSGEVEGPISRVKNQKSNWECTPAHLINLTDTVGFVLTSFLRFVTFEL